MTFRFFHYVLVTALIALASMAEAQAPQKLEYHILRETAHDPTMFTQGLITQSELLVETAGGYGRSLIRRYQADSGTMVNQVEFPPRVFAEGVAQVGEQLFVLTWRKGICYVLDAETLALEKRHKYQGEGWGLAYDGQHLIMSDGSDTLTLRDPADFSPVGNISVTGLGHSWHNLNELEYAQGLIWANIWQDSRILAIDPQTGAVKGILDLSALVQDNSTQPRHSVLNGIAYDEDLRAFWVTGKLWPKRYLLKITWPLNND